MTGFLQHLVPHVNDHRLGNVQLFRIVVRPLEIRMFRFDRFFDILAVDGVGPLV